MKITVHLRPDAGLNSDKQQQTTPQANEVAEAVKDLGVTLEPMHPGAESPRLSNSFAVEVPDAATAEQVINRLQNCEAVEAAYLKPPEALP
jgi:hypothetical protein